MRFLLFAFVVLIWTAVAPTSRAAAQTANTTLSAAFNTQADLTLSTASISFPDADPDAVPQVPAAGGPIIITAKGRATRNAQVRLTVQASGNLQSGTRTIPATNITWTATGAGFVAGTLRTSAVTVGTWTGSGVHSGSQQLFFRNLWTHPTGTYTLTMVYTLTAP